MRLDALFIGLLILSVSVAAQPGPAPGYATAAEYATDYAASQAENVSRDPAGYAQDRASESALRNETSHTVYMACWAADDAGVRSEACDPYYTPRGHEQPDQPPCECNATAVDDEAARFTNATADATHGLVEDAAKFANATLSDPANATSHLQRFADAVVGFAKGVAGGTVGLLLWIVHAITDCLGLGLDGIRMAAGSVAAVGGLLADTVQAGALSVGTAGQQSAQGVAAVSAAAASGIATATSATGHALATAASATGQGIAAAGQAIGHGASVALHATGDALQAVGHAIADVASAVKDAVTGLWTSEPAQATDDVRRGLGVEDTATGLLDGATGLLS